MDDDRATPVNRHQSLKDGPVCRIIGPVWIRGHLADLLLSPLFARFGSSVLAALFVPLLALMYHRDWTHAADLLSVSALMSPSRITIAWKRPALCGLVRKIQLCRAREKVD